MKKVFAVLIVMLVVCLAAVSFAACNDDEGRQPSAPQGGTGVGEAPGTDDGSSDEEESVTPQEALDAVAEAVDAYHFGITPSHRDFLVERYIEDAGYCGLVRARVTRVLGQYGVNYFDVLGQESAVSKRIFQELERFIREEMSSIAPRVTLRRVWMPWHRMFEIGLDASLQAQPFAKEA